jgi:hypothetical protein
MASTPTDRTRLLLETDTVHSIPVLTIAPSQAVADLVGLLLAERNAGST